MNIEVDEFTMDIQYNKEQDELRLSTDRELKNSDVLLVLIHVLGMVDKDSRNEVLELAVAVLAEREAAAARNAN